ncbi:hypothetical protein P7C70_g5203, partial [Phenoliferia sp. Uapishka_3]
MDREQYVCCDEPALRASFRSNSADPRASRRFRKAGYEAIDRVCEYMETMEQGKVDVIAPVAPGYLAPLIADSVPVAGEDWSTISGDFDKVIMPGITHWQHPSFFAYFRLDVSFQHEGGVGGGIIMGSASESCLTAVIAARERALRILPTATFENLVIYGTTQTHSVGAKAALILGLEFRAIETKEDDLWGLRGSTLKAALDEDIAKGKVPFALLVTLGSTSTGAIDNIAEVTAVAADYPALFIHCDAAWAGVYLACPELREGCQLDAINARSNAIGTSAAICASGEVHSFCTNLHKSGLVTFDASCLWIRDRTLLTEALDVTPPFLRNKHSDSGAVVDFRNWQLALGRRFRSLKLMFVLRSHGVNGFQSHLRKLNSHAAHFSSLVLSSPNEFELFVPRRFSLVVFRLRGVSDADSDRLNREFFARTSERKDIHLTPTIVGGKYCTRLAVGSPFTKVEHIEKAWELIQELAADARRAVGEKEVVA